MTSLLVAGSDVLAAASTEQNNFGDTRSGALAGPLGLVFILLLGIATVLLIRNMNSRIKRLPESFDGNGNGEGKAPGGPVAGGTEVRGDSAPETAETVEKADGGSDRPAG